VEGRDFNCGGGFGPQGGEDGAWFNGAAVEAKGNVDKGVERGEDVGN